MNVLRDLRRQPGRTVLTILGIAIGIFALVVFGALAEHFRSIVEEAKSYVRGSVRIVTKTNKAGQNPGIDDADIQIARALPNVRAVTPTLVLLLDGYNLEDDPILFLTPKPLVEGIPPEHAEAMRPGIRLIEGRWLKKGDDEHLMVVGWLARRRNWKVGDTVPVRHLQHKIVGIFEGPDVAVVPAGMVPYKTLRRSFQAPNVARAKQFFKQGQDEAEGGLQAFALKQLEKLAEQFVAQYDERYYPYEVIPEHDSPEATAAIAKALREKLPHIAVIEPDALAKQMENAVAIFLAITALVSVISSVVGGLLIVNTMAMAVVERRREVAIKVAIGASTGQIASEFLIEAAVMGFAGAFLGVLAGVLAIAVLDPWIVAKVEVGDSLFKLTPTLIISAVGFGVGLGTLAGLVPALRAARSDPAPGLREL